jgi:hypothetical protein
MIPTTIMAYPTPTTSTKSTILNKKSITSKIKSNNEDINSMNVPSKKKTTENNTPKAKTRRNRKSKSVSNNIINNLPLKIIKKPGNIQKIRTVRKKINFISLT